MSIVTVLVYIVVVVLLVAAAIWVIGYLVPDHPKIIDRALWVFAVVIIALMLLQAFGLMGAGPRVPQLG